MDGRETSYFEWMGAGFYSTDRSVNIDDDSICLLRELHCGFSEQYFYLRIDAFPELLPKLRDCEFQIIVRGSEELRLDTLIEGRCLVGWLLETDDLSILGPHPFVKVAFERILEVVIDRRLLPLAGQAAFALKVGLWERGFTSDFLPLEDSLEVKLGIDAFAWPVH